MISWVELIRKDKEKFRSARKIPPGGNGLLTIKYRAIVDYIQRKRVELCVSFAKPQLHIGEAMQFIKRTKDNLKYYYISEIEYAI